MNRRGFLSLSLLAPVAGVMAARDAMAATPQWDTVMVRGMAGEAFIGEAHDGSLLKPLNVIRKLRVEVQTFGVDNIAPKIPARPSEDETVSAQFESDLAFLRDEPGVAS